jgi:hypothetical protein
MDYLKRFRLNNLKPAGETYSPRKPIITRVAGERWAGDPEGVPVRRHLVREGRPAMTAPEAESRTRAARSEAELSLRQRQAIARAKANTGTRFHYPSRLGWHTSLLRWRDKIRALANRVKLLITR